MNGKKLQKTQNRGRRKGSPLRHKQYYTSVYFPFKLHCLCMIICIPIIPMQIPMINNVSRTLVYSKRHSSEILLNVIYWSWRSILSSSKEHPMRLPFIWMNTSSQIRGHSCGLLLPATIKWRATWILCAFWRASHWFPSLLTSCIWPWWTGIKF